MTKTYSIACLFLLATFARAQDSVSVPPSIIALGDSITKGARLGVSNRETFSALVGRERNQEVLNLGIGGERTDQALKRLDAAVIMRRPKMVFVMYGTNDSYIDRGKNQSRITVDAYRDNLSEIVQKLMSVGIEPILMTPPRWANNARMNGVGESPNHSLVQFVDACRDVAKNKQIPIIDHFAHWTSAETRGRDLNDWTTDGCHPNPAGHAEIAKLILDYLREI